MFSDELAGNASKRRQEQSKARRRKLKEQKLKSQNKEKDSSTVGDGDSDKPITSNNSIIGKDNAISGGAKAHAPAESSSGTESAKNSAVAIALEQRKLRSYQKLHNSSATTIQASFRAYKSNNVLAKSQKGLLEKRISDLMILSQLLHKQNKSYVPPPSLVNLMMNQMLFVLHSTARNRKMSIIDENGKDEQISVAYFATISDYLTKKDGQNFAKLIEYAILPGLLSSDDHMDPSLQWLESKEGQVKFKKILRVCCHLILARQRVASKKNGNIINLVMPFVASEDDVSVIYKLFQAVLGSNKMAPARSSVIAFCNKIFLSTAPPANVPKPLTLGQKPSKIETLDLLHILRSFLLYPSGKKICVIPTNAERDRRKCISDLDRQRATGLFALLSTVARNDLHLMSRFVIEIYTVPLLTWRVEQNEINTMIGNGGHTRMPPFMCNVSAFLKIYEAKVLSTFTDVLSSADIPLKLCPAPPVLSLCANMACFATSSPIINGIDRAAFNADVATLFFNFMTLLLDIVPIGALSSRESEVGWIEQGSHITPIVLSSVVREQCKLLLVDSFTRELFNIASDPNKINADAVLQKKDTRDFKLEKELDEISSQSVVSVAAKEAMVIRSTGFWKKSKWAKTLATKVTSFLSTDKKGKHSLQKGEGALMNTTTLSRELAHGRANDKLVSESKYRSRSKHGNDLMKLDFNPDFLFALTRTYATIVSRWGGIGHHVIMGCNFYSEQTKDQKHKRSVEKRDPKIIPFLNVLSFSTAFLKTSWAIIQSNPYIKSDLEGSVDVEKGLPIRSANVHPSISDGRLHYAKHTGSALLLLFNSALAHTLIITDDVELHELELPLPIHQIRRIIVLLKNILYRACCLDVKSKAYSSGSNHIGLSLISSSAKVQRDLYDRSSRRLLCSPKTWLIDDLLDEEIRRSKSHEDYLAMLHEPVLKLCPFLVSFKRRLKLFERIIVTNRERIQGSNDGHSFRPGIHVHIMRTRVLEDGLIHLNKLGSDLRKRIIVHYVNAAGATESGLDAGGLFKEFWTDLSNQSLNPNWALFRETEDGFLFPSPSSRAAHGSDSIMLFEFLGRILGKAIYEGITIQPQFAHFFLSFVRGDYNYLHMLADLSTMDRTLYNNLMFLKTYEGNAEDLCLSFAVARNEFGNNEEIPLLPGGQNKDVTDLNKHHYIELVAKHHVCDQVKEQSEAFRRGLWDVIDRQWLRIFNEPELQIVISGATDGTVDVEDMKANTKYAGGYTMFDRNIHQFWKVVSSFNKKQRGDLLRFVTSCERPPPLGFASMNPHFTIQRVSINRDDEKLPTSSTCFNVLKLPTYSSEKVMKEKLLYSIQSGSGFELT